MACVEQGSVPTPPTRSIRDRLSTLQTRVDDLRRVAGSLENALDNSSQVENAEEANPQPPIAIDKWIDILDQNLVTVHERLMQIANRI